MDLGKGGIFSKSAQIKVCLKKGVVFTPLRLSNSQTAGIPVKIFSSTLPMNVLSICMYFSNNQLS